MASKRSSGLAMTVEELYEEATGKKPETRFPDDPDWLYRGRKEEKDEMLDRHGLRDGSLAIIEGQEELEL